MLCLPLYSRAVDRICSTIICQHYQPDVASLSGTTLSVATACFSAASNLTATAACVSVATSFFSNSPFVSAATTCLSGAVASSPPLRRSLWCHHLLFCCSFPLWCHCLSLRCCSSFTGPDATSHLLCSSSDYFSGPASAPISCDITSASLSASAAAAASLPATTPISASLSLCCHHLFSPTLSPPGCTHHPSASVSRGLLRPAGYC